MRYVLKQEVSEIDFPLLIVCEGMGDAAFVNALLKHLGITNCRIGVPNPRLSKGQGIDAIGSYLTAIRALEQLKGQELTGILIIADNDDNPASSEKKIRRAFEIAGFRPPASTSAVEQVNIQNTRLMYVGMHMIPATSEPGTLEHLLLKAVRQNGRTRMILTSAYLHGIGTVRKAKQNQRAKMAMSTLVGATCRNNPWASLTLMWHDADTPVSLESSALGSLRQLLTDFSQIQGQLRTGEA